MPQTLSQNQAVPDNINRLHVENEAVASLSTLQQEELHEAEAWTSFEKEAFSLH